MLESSCRASRLAPRMIAGARLIYVQHPWTQNLSYRGYATHSHYDILDLPRDSSQKEIKNKFYELSRKHHPDIAPDSTRKFTEINAAYSILRDEKTRRDYDRTLSADTASSSNRSSSGYRTASGLSRRKTRPMGTPPSSPYRAAPSSPADNTAGFGFGSNPNAAGDVRNRHFEFEQHRERHSTFDMRYTAKQQEELSRRNTEMQDNFLARFVGIAGLIFIVILLTGGISNVRAEVTEEQRRAEETKQRRCQEVDWECAIKSRSRAINWKLWNTDP